MKSYYKNNYVESRINEIYSFNEFDSDEEITNDVFDYFVNTPTEKHQDILEFWLKREYGSLNDFALDILSCPATSAGIESIFSEMKNIIKDNRRRLTDNHLNQTQLVKSWKEIISSLKYYFCLSN